MPKKKPRTHRVYDYEKSVYPIRKLIGITKPIYFRFLLPIVDFRVLKILGNTDSLMCSDKIKPVKKKINEVSDVDYEVPKYDYKNPNDSLYCPAHDNDNDDGGDHFDDAGGCDFPMEFSIGNMGDNLVEAPEMVCCQFVCFY